MACSDPGDSIGPSTSTREPARGQNLGRLATAPDPPQTVQRSFWINRPRPRHGLQRDDRTRLTSSDIIAPRPPQDGQPTIACTTPRPEVGEDSVLGCGFLPPGSDVADIVVNALLRDGDVASLAAEGFPNATDIIPVDVGEDTVAVTTPSGDAIASVITASGGRLVELAIVFLLIDPEDTARIEEAATLAVTALERWD